ncbi:MAG: T9SS type A sorting domain-containing protein [Cyclobacteriaceae bacterium]
MSIRSYLVSLSFIGFASTALAQVPVYVNFDLNHMVGGESEFDRTKWINVHSANYEGAWNGQAEEMDYLLNELDAYMIRETGLVTGNVSSGTVESITNTSGPNWKSFYSGKTAIHEFESRQDLIIANQHRIYDEMDATTTAERTTAFLDSFFGEGGTDGMPKPKYFEILNEPLFPFVDFPPAGQSPEPIIDIFNYHKDVAIKMKELSPETKVGGYVAAFLIFEENNFQRWNDRWKLYIDVAGEHTDFYSAHFYDFPGIGNGIEQYRKGANNEATLDMLEHYTHLVDKEKPLLISEYGSQVHDWYGEQWSSFRDWLFLKAANSMMIQFMERPDRIEKALPFTVIKAQWGFGFTGPNIPYPWRMMRQDQEPSNYTPSGYSGEWVWTDYIKFYELWDEVNGTRIDTKSEDINIQTDAYVDGNKAYVVFNSLIPESTTVQPTIDGLNANEIESVRVRHLYLASDNTVKLDYTDYAYDPEQVLALGAEATMIVEYTFKEEMTIDNTSNETKYYATDYLKSIQGEQPISFEVNGVQTSDHGEAVLRVGAGRDHASSLTPIIKLNGTRINSQIAYRGDNQDERPKFFGLLEIDVPYNLVEENNTVEVTFPESGGHVSSVALQVFNFSREVERGSEVMLSTGNELSNELKVFPNPFKGIVSLSNIQPDNYQLRILGLDGKLIHADSFEIKTAETRSIDLSALKQGVYLLKLTGLQRNYKQRVIVR